MFLKMNKALGLLAAAGIALAAGVSGAQAQVFQDNWLGYRYGTAFKEPGVAGGADISKNILSYSHASGDKWGDNFFNLDILMSSAKDPSVADVVGAQELYALYRRGFSYNKITGTKGGYGPIADFGLLVGADYNAKNTQFGSEKKLLLAGAYLDWSVPAGFLRTAFLYCQEWNQHGFANVGADYDPQFCLATTWKFPFKIGPASMAFGGFFNVNSPKGRGNPALNETKTEIFTRPELTLDIGELVTGRKNFVEVGVAYEYWLNKFGNDNSLIVGAIARTPMLTAKVHF